MNMCINCDENRYVLSKSSNRNASPANVIKVVTLFLIFIDCGMHY
jgi:hypothetical protein